MILLTFKHDGEYRLGVKTEEGILDVAAANRALNIPGLADTPERFFAAGQVTLPMLADFVERATDSETRAAWLLDEDRLEIGPCVPRPGKIICIGLNYLKHAQESKMNVPTVPVLFAKFQNSIAAAGEEIPLPPVARRYDYEAELAVVIGKRAKYVSEEEALECVLGYCNANDVSARELQNLTSQWTLGKAIDKFLPIGPYLVTADEAGDPQNWPVRCWLNEELRQDSNTSDMIFGVAQLISFISKHMTLCPGDLISTGTPQGVVLGMSQPRTWMKAGDTVTVEVGPLGRLTNKLTAEQVDGIGLTVE